MGRAAKKTIEGVDYYVEYRGVVLHGQEGYKFGLPRRINISTSSGSSCISQTDEGLAEDIEGTAMSAVTFPGENRKGGTSARTVLTSPNHDVHNNSPPSSPLESRKRSRDSTSGFPSSSKKKMMVQEEILEEDNDEVVLLRRAVINFQELFLKADELVHQLKQSRKINTYLNAWRGVALQYNLLSDDAEKLL